MKKIFFTALIAAFYTSAHLQAQSLYRTVYEKAISIVNSAQSSQEQIEINQFEVTVLNYIQAQAKSRGLQKDEYFFDSQAVNLKSFIDDFVYYLNKARAISSSKRNEVIACYRDASLNNPLFNDLNKDRAFCYVNDTKSLTPFSLDTDWEKAYDQATLRIKAIIK